MGKVTPAPEKPASMEPSLISEGNHPFGFLHGLGNQASMEPSLISEGNPCFVVICVRHASLQWSPR